MNETKAAIKLLALITTGLVVGVVLGRVGKSENKKINGRYKVVTRLNPIIVEIDNGAVEVSYHDEGERIKSPAFRMK